MLAKLIFYSLLTQFNLHPQDVPSDGLFIAPPSSLEELVYIRTLTYGVTAYFVIASNNSYQNVLEAFKNSFMDEYYNPNGTITRIPNYFINDIRYKPRSIYKINIQRLK